MGMPPRNATTVVNITVLDQNDNCPVIHNISVVSSNVVLSVLMDNVSLVVIPENHSPYTTVSNKVLIAVNMAVNSLSDLMLLILMREIMVGLFISFKMILIILLIVSYIH